MQGRYRGNEKRGISLACCGALLVAFLGGCQVNGSSITEYVKRMAELQQTEVQEVKVKGETVKEETAPRKVIIDTDTGADDAAAIILAAKTENIEILGVTTLVGNVSLDQSTKNAIAALETAGCDASVYEGAEDTYTGKKVDAFSVYGEDGMGDEDLIHPKREAEKEDAINGEELELY